MFEIRIHGRGGQGVVTAAELLAVAAFTEGRHAQAFPSFGSERTGAPVVSFCRIAERPIRTHEPVISPDGLIIVDPTLLHQVDVFRGLKPDGWIVINSSRSVNQMHLNELLSRFRAERLQILPATAIARRHLGRPLPNAALLGAFARLTGSVSISGLTEAIGQRFAGPIAAGNAAAAEAAFELVSRPVAQLEAAHA